MRLELESLDQSRKRGRGERSGRLWLYGRPAIKKREQQAGLAWLAGCLAARATRTGTRAAARGEWVQSLQWVDQGERVGWRRPWRVGQGVWEQWRQESLQQGGERAPPDHGRLFKVFQTPES
jgi:hypothetical protein